MAQPKSSQANRSHPKTARTRQERTDVKAKHQPKKLGPLTGIAHDLFTHVLNSIAFEQYGDCCTVDDIAERFGKTPGQLQPAIRKLVEQGYVTVEGNLFPIIYPTTAALRHQDSRLSETQAKQILAKVRDRG
jgi:hypothetical protein